MNIDANGAGGTNAGDDDTDNRSEGQDGSTGEDDNLDISEAKYSLEDLISYSGIRCSERSTVLELVQRYEFDQAMGMVESRPAVVGVPESY